jgi:diketogulonate reductase-like aldo/keto reductase
VNLFDCSAFASVQRLAAYAPLAPLHKFRGGPVDAVLTELTQAHRQSTGAVLMRYAQQSGYTVITTSSQIERLREAVQVVVDPTVCAPAFTLSAEEMQRLDAAGQAQEPQRIFWSKEFAALGS